MITVLLRYLAELYMRVVDPRVGADSVDQHLIVVEVTEQVSRDNSRTPIPTIVKKIERRGWLRILAQGEAI
jgi:hypothetical protein